MREGGRERRERQKKKINLVSLGVEPRTVSAEILQERKKHIYVKEKS